MLDVKRLLVAIDLHRDGLTLTAGSCAAMDQAVELARRTGCGVVLLHATGPGEVGEQAHFAALDARACAQRVLASEAKRFQSLGAEVEVVFSEETAWLAILRHVLRGGIDLVIAGRRSERSHDGRRFGSVSMKLLRECPCAVWVAKLGSAVVPRRVLAASDLSPTGERVIAYAAFVAARYGAALHVLHAFHGVEPDVHRERDERMRRLAEQLARAEPAPNAELHVLRATPSQAVLDCCARVEPDLVVLGTLSHGGLAGRLVGSTAERLLGRLDVSLLALKPDDFVCPVTLDA